MPSRKDQGGIGENDHQTISLNIEFIDYYDINKKPKRKIRAVTSLLQKN